MNAAREVKDPASARGEVRPAGRVRARAAAPTRDDSVWDGRQRGARSARRRAIALEADTRVSAMRYGYKEAEA